MIPALQVTASPAVVDPSFAPHPVQLVAFQEENRLKCNHTFSTTLAALLPGQGLFSREGDWPGWHYPVDGCLCPPQEAALSLCGTVPDVSFLTVFLWVLGHLSVPCFMAALPGARAIPPKLPATTSNFIPNTFPFPSQLSTFASHGSACVSSTQGKKLREKKRQRAHWSFPHFTHYWMLTTYHFPNFCMCDPLVAHLSKLRSSSWKSC